MASADSDGKDIEEKKSQLREAGAQNHWDPDEEHEPFCEERESLAKQRDHLDDKDLEFISDILDSFSRPSYNYNGSNNLKLKSITPEDALARACTPQRLNLKFNQNLMTRGSEEDHFSYFSNLEEGGPSELGDYFSDDEDDDTWNKTNLTSENNPWSHTDFNDSEENHTPSPPTLSDWDPVISSLETISEANSKMTVRLTNSTTFRAFQKKPNSRFQHGDCLFLQNMPS
jgi:hypothetical protein